RARSRSSARTSWGSASVASPSTAVWWAARSTRVGKSAAPLPSAAATEARAGGKRRVLVALASAERGAQVAPRARDVAMHVAAADPSPVAVERKELSPKLTGAAPAR